MVTPCDLLWPVRMAKLVHMCLKRISETVSEADVGLYVQIPTWSWRTAGPTSSLKLTLPDQSSTISVPFQSVMTQRQISRWSFCKNNTFFTWISFTFPKLWFICVCVCLPLCVCWLAARGSSHLLLPAESSGPDQPPVTHTYLTSVFHSHFTALMESVGKSRWLWVLFYLCHLPWPWAHTPLVLQAESYWTSQSQL